MKRNIIGIIIIVLIILAMTFAFTKTPVVEGFQPNPATQHVPSDGKIPTGFYQIDTSTMAELPNNEIVSPIPNTTQGFYIPEGYYSVKMDNMKWMAKVPVGFIANPSKDGILPQTTTQTGKPINAAMSPGYAGSGGDVENNPISAKAYDTNNYDIQYHDDIEDLIAQGGVYDLSFGTMIVRDATGKEVAIPYVPGRALPIYNVPGSFTYGPSTYVPNYADSIFLSRSTGLSTVSTAVPVSSELGGFCEHAKTNPTELEVQCNRLPTDVCASTKCCVLLGGHKCVSGDERGPKMKSNYTDPFIRNKDLYYYQGKCYGNC